MANASCQESGGRRTAGKHNPQWANRVRGQLRSASVELVVAPLKQTGDVEWYDWRPPDDARYHLILVDAPPGHTPGKTPGRQGCFDITDPPYCSGGLTAGARRMDPVDKYCTSGDARGRPSFGGDLKDQRSFTWWCSAWLIHCRRLLKSGGYCLVFTDWRQLPALTDAFQAADLTWRGVLTWDKGGGSRAPHKGYFRHQCEFVVWGTKGPCPPASHAGPFPGCYPVKARKADKFHLTGKPTELLRKLVHVVPPGARILDPFAGSGTTLVAAQELGRHAVGIERELEYCEIGQLRIESALPSGQLGPDRFEGRQLAV